MQMLPITIIQLSCILSLSALSRCLFGELVWPVDVVAARDDDGQVVGAHVRLAHELGARLRKRPSSTRAAGRDRQRGLGHRRRYNRQASLLPVLGGPEPARGRARLRGRLQATRIDVNGMAQPATHVVGSHDRLGWSGPHLGAGVGIGRL